MEETLDGACPYGALMQGSDGNFYGTTAAGGVLNASEGGNGTVFKVTPQGQETILHNFTGRGGKNPRASLIQGLDGNFYGTTRNGGVYDYGTIFKITQQGQYTCFDSFTGGNDGANPNSGLIQAIDGNFYGTTESGGTEKAGTVFKVTPSGWKTVLYSFTGGNNDGAIPKAGLIQASDGNFYGTTEDGGFCYNGTVFKVTPQGQETVLYSFAGGNDGAKPQAGVIQGTDGNFYGTTWVGGAKGYGTVFKLTSQGEEIVLHSFTGRTDGAYPYAGLIKANDGNFYGTTTGGGIRDDNIYGTQTHGGHGDGTVFKVTPQGVETVLHRFGGGVVGSHPHGGVIQGSDGNFYGTTPLGGLVDEHGNLIRDIEGFMRIVSGTIFKVTPQGVGTVLYIFYHNKPLSVDC